MPTVVPIVEGPGDASAVPGLLYWILRERCNRPDIIVAQGGGRLVVTNGRSNLETKLGQFLGYAQNQRNCDGILILLDSDNDCPVQLAQNLSEQCHRIGARVSVEIVCSQRSYESWFLASWNTVRDRAGLPGTDAPGDPSENVINPKQWINNLLPRGLAYKETSDQAPYTAAIDLDLAHQNSRSFRRLCHALEQLVGAMDQTTTA